MVSMIKCLKTKMSEFEVLDISNIDYPEIRSVNISPRLEKEENKPRSKSGQRIAENPRKESKIEKIKNIGTNMRFELGTLYQKLMLYKQIGNNGKPKECVLFGNKYEVYDGQDELNIKFLKAYQDIIWFTYRKNFPILLDNKLSPADYYINDTGWGCMIRVCQMMLAETIKRSIIESEGKILNLKEKLISLFLDSQTNEQESPFSIQNICKYLYDEFKLKPGQWFKASTVFLVIQQIHAKHKDIFFERLNSKTKINLDIEIFLEGTIYLNKIAAFLSTNTKSSKLTYGFEEVKEDVIKEDLNDSKTDISYEDSKKRVLIVVLTKIGLDQPNPEYFPFIKEYLDMPECIGMIGGRPGLAYYFVGYIENTLVYLDPHFVQETIHSRSKLKENLQTYSCKQHRIVDMGNLDTSAGFGFLINGYENFKDFRRRFKEIAAKQNSFLGIQDEAPLFDEISVNEEETRYFDDFEEL